MLVPPPQLVALQWGLLLFGSDPLLFPAVLRSSEFGAYALFLGRMQRSGQSARGWGRNLDSDPDCAGELQSDRGQFCSPGGRCSGSLPVVPAGLGPPQSREGALSKVQDLGIELPEDDPRACSVPAVRDLLQVSSPLCALVPASVNGDHILFTLGDCLRALDEPMHMRLI